MRPDEDFQFVDSGMDARDVWHYVLNQADCSGPVDRNPLIVRLLDLYALWRYACDLRMRRSAFN